MQESFALHIPTEFTINNVCLVSDSHVVVCCNKATIFSIKFANSYTLPTMTQAKIPDLDSSVSIYSVINTNNLNDMNEHLFCTSSGLYIRNSSSAKLSEPFVTNSAAQYQSIEALEGKTVFQIVLIDKEQSRFAVHYAPHQVAIYDNVSKRVLREFSFPDLLSIYTMQTVMELPCILLREKKSISLFNMDLNYKIQVRSEIGYNITEQIDLQTACVCFNTKFPSSIQILYIEHSFNDKKKEHESKVQAINIDAKKIA